MPDAMTACKEWARHRAGTKCELCAAEPGIAWRPYGGATTYAGFDEFKRAEDLLYATYDEQWVFESIVENIRTAEDMDAMQKARAIAAAATEFESRMAHAIAGERAIAAGGAAKAMTKRVDGVDLDRGDFADQGIEDDTATWKLPLVSAPGVWDADRIADAITALQPGGFRGNEVELTNARGTVIGRIRSAIGDLDDEDDRERLTGRLDDLSEKEMPNVGGFRAWRDKDGAWRWLAIYTNNFRDREGEIFSAASHRAYVKEVEKSGRYPALELWHVPQPIGHADMIDYDDETGFMVATGTFDKDWSHVAESLSGAEGIGCSHGYSYGPGDLVDGIYYRYFTHEISALPVERAANELTAFVAGKEWPEMDQAKQAFLEQHMGAEAVSELRTRLRELRDDAAEKGIAYKDVVDAVASPPAAAPDAPAAPAASADGDGDAPAPVLAEAEAVAGEAAAESPPAGDAPPESQVAEQAADEQKDVAAGVAMEQFAALIESAVSAAIAPLEARVEAMGTEMKSLGQKVDADVETGIDAYLTDLIAPRVGRPVIPLRASESDDNAPPPGVVKQLEDAAKSDDGKSLKSPVDGYLTDIRSALASINR